MLHETQGITCFIVICRYTDLRKGISGLAQIIEGNFKLNPFEANTLFLFCGRRGDRIKALLWEGNGFSFSINAGRMALYHGPGRQMR